MGTRRHGRTSIRHCEGSLGEGGKRGVQGRGPSENVFANEWKRGEKSHSLVQPTNAKSEGKILIASEAQPHHRKMEQGKYCQRVHKRPGAGFSEQNFGDPPVTKKDPSMAGSVGSGPGKGGA